MIQPPAKAENTEGGEGDVARLCGDHIHFRAEEARNHVLVYVDWEWIRAWKREELSRGVRKKEKVNRHHPYVYGSSNTTFGSYVKSGSIIWIWTCPEYADKPRIHRLPPSLVARLHVKKVVSWESSDNPFRGLKTPERLKKKWKWIGLGCPHCSAYFPVNNVFEVFRGLFSRDKKGDERAILPERGLPIAQNRSPYYSLPSLIRFPKRLGERGVSNLIEHADAVAGRQTVFVSYCRADDRDNFAGHLVEAMTERNLAPWLDMKAIPDRLATGAVKVDDVVLEQIFKDGIRQASGFVALVGDKYRSSRYAMEEWEIAKEAAMNNPNFVRRQISLDDCRIRDPYDSVPVVSGTPIEMADVVAEALAPTAGES